ncbi:MULTISPECIES: hypothetical protein [Bacillus]|uniref:hypothetical protein n=1 Tax=Bacillus TaxID=1386 RepID=UPI0003810906|nr:MULTISPECIES: hypothetical protein [Bacillus]
MDHVMNSLRNWKHIFEETVPDDKKAIKCIDNALTELHKYHDRKITDNCISCGVPVGNTNKGVNTKIGKVCKECCI